MTKDATPREVGLSDQLGLVPEQYVPVMDRGPQDTAHSEMVRLFELSARQAADVQVLEAAVAVVLRALDDLVGACTDADGKPCAPDHGVVMRARSMLPPACKHALKKA